MKRRHEVLGAVVAAVVAASGMLVTAATGQSAAVAAAGGTGTGYLHTSGKRSWTARTRRSG